MDVPLNWSKMNTIISTTIICTTRIFKYLRFVYDQYKSADINLTRAFATKFIVQPHYIRVWHFQLSLSFLHKLNKKVVPILRCFLFFICNLHFHKRLLDFQQPRFMSFFGCDFTIFLSLPITILVGFFTPPIIQEISLDL